MTERVEFPSTIWATIQERPEKARATIFELYRTPIFNYLRRQGHQEQDAEDLAQEVFIRVCREEFLRKAHPSKGRFRSLLLAVTRHVILKARERDRRRREVPIEPDFESLQKAPADAEFDTFWVQNIIRRALDAMRAEAAPGSPPYADAVALTKLENQSYAEAAKRLGASVTDITNWVHQGKKLVRLELRKLVGAYCSSPAEYREEMQMVSKDFW
jgi:RNA polymerase sigma factor (sigma-70 family)